MITIVSGLPRSGTSLMMQMLAAGGLPVLSDGERKADTDNPRGYLEWERIKKLPKEPGLIAEAEGKVVKVISQLAAFTSRRTRVSRGLHAASVAGSAQVAGRNAASPRQRSMLWETTRLSKKHFSGI